MRLPWAEIDTVLLDMDGTLLDLNFDNHFWQVYVPEKFAQRHGLSAPAARAECVRRYQAKAGTLDWYCVDYWTKTLGLDIARLKEELAHLIVVHPDVREFLVAVRHCGKRVMLVTNAHHKSLTLKMRRTGLDVHFDAIHSSHGYGIAKEDPLFWGALRRADPYRPQRTLLVDDSLPVLRAAAHYGIGHLLAIDQPDASQPPRAAGEFRSVHRFSEIMPSGQPS